MGYGKKKSNIYMTNNADQSALDHLAHFTPTIDVSGKGKKKVKFQ